MCIFNSKNPFLQNIRHFLVVQQARSLATGILLLFVLN